MSAKMRAPATNMGHFDTCVHPRAWTSGTKTAREFRQTKIIFIVFSQEADCEVQQSDRLHKRFGSTPVEETLRVFVSLEDGLQSPKDDRLHNVRIYLCCRDLACFFAFLKVVRKVPKNDRLRKVRIHAYCGTLRALLRLARCQERLKCSGVAQCTNFVYVLGALCDFTFQKVFRRSGFLWILRSPCRTGGFRPPV